MVDEPRSFIFHLEALRKRLIIAGRSWLLAFFACYSFTEPLFLYKSEPLREVLLECRSLVFLTFVALATPLLVDDVLCHMRQKKSLA